MKPRKWQKEAKLEWRKNSCRGTVEACTGSGKTFFAIDIIKDIAGKILIIVPTIPLMKQWKKELKNNGLDSGLFYSAKKENKRIVVAVDKSLHNKTIQGCEMLIYDEVHKGQSKNNSKFLLRNNFEKILGLSATPEREDDANDFILKIAPVIYKYNIKQAIEDKVLCPYDVFDIPVEFKQEELMEYNICNKIIKRIFPDFDYDLKKAMNSIRYNRNAAELMKAVSKRKQLIYEAQNKVVVASSIIRNKPENKIIVFDERVSILDILLEKGGFSDRISCLYHSKMKKKEKEKSLEVFRATNSGVMLSAKALEEGINIPKCDIAILINGSSVRRQFIQRVGRVLRTADNKSKAIIYRLYVPNTKDEDWLKKSKNIL